MKPPVETNSQPSHIARKWECLPRSLRTFLVHTAIVTLSVLMFLSPLSHKPGPIHPLLVVPFFYLLICPLPYLVSLVLGIRDVIHRPRKVASGIALGGSLLALAGIYRFVAFYWNAMMYI